MLLILDPELAKDVFVKSFKHFNYNAVADTVMLGDTDAFESINLLFFSPQIVPKTDPLFAGNPFIYKDEAWKESRTEISPALTVLKVFIGYFQLPGKFHRI